MRYNFFSLFKQRNSILLLLLLIGGVVASMYSPLNFQSKQLPINSLQSTQHEKEDAHKKAVLAKLFDIPLYFEKNEGQMNERFIAMTMHTRSFTATLAVYFGAIPAESFVVDDNTQITWRA